MSAAVGTAASSQPTAPPPDPLAPSEPAAPSPARVARLHRVGRDLWAVVPQWLVARVVVIGTLALAHLVVDRTHPQTSGVALRVHQGLLGWDAGWYEAIARVGYRPLGHQALRFFPLFPLVSRALAQLPGISDGIAVVVIANLSALVGTALLRVLVARETGDVRLAERTVWVVSLAPPAFVLVMGYSEGMLLVATVGCLLAIRRGSGRGEDGTAAPWWWLAAVFGAIAGLTRPLGVLLVVPVAVEAIRHWRRSTARRRFASGVAVAAPAVATLGFLGWSWEAFGNFFLPVDVQTEAGHHGGLTDPLRVLLNDVRGVVHHHYGTALHVPWVVLAVALVVVCWRRLPASYGALGTAVILAALSGTNLSSFERYAWSAFPLAIAAASLLGRPKLERSVMALLVAGLVAYSLLAFLNLYVP